MRYKTANDGYGICKNCGKYEYMTKGMCFECRKDQMIHANRKFLSKKGGKSC